MLPLITVIGQGLTSVLSSATSIFTSGIQKGLDKTFDYVMDNKLPILTHGFEGLLQQGFSDILSTMEEQIKSKDLKIGAEDFSPYGSIGYWDKIYSYQKDVNRQLGVAGELGRNMETSFQQGLNNFAQLGVEAQNVAEDYGNFIKSIGRNQELTSAELTRFAELRAVYGKDASEIFSYFNDLGMSIKDTSKDLKNLLKESSDMGLNSTKVMETLEKNLRAASKFNFKDGVKGMEKMAQMAVKTRLEMSSMLDFADKIWDNSIEGTIDMGANLQILGGEFAALGDPFELFYLARNAPEEFSARIQDAVKGVAQFNQATGEIDIDALGLSQLRELSKITGVGLEELVASAKTARKEITIGGLFDTSIKSAEDFEQTLTKVAGAASFDKEANQWMVTIDGAKKSIQSLRETDIGQLGALDVGVSAEDSMMSIVKSNETLVEALNRTIEAFKLSYVSTSSYQAMDNFINKIQTSTSTILDTIGVGFKAISDKSGINFENVLNPISEGNISGTANSLGENLVNTGLGMYGVVKQGYNTLTEGMWLPNLPDLGESKNPLQEVTTPSTRQVVPIAQQSFKKLDYNDWDSAEKSKNNSSGNKKQTIDLIINNNGDTKTIPIDKNVVNELILNVIQGNNSSGGISIGR